MADFVAVLKKTLAGMGETTPAGRARVYAKARATIDSKLSALNPPPPAAVAERQKRALEDAISTVEAEYAAPPPASSGDPLDELESVFSSINAQRQSPAPQRPATPPPPPQRQAPVPREPSREAPVRARPDPVPVRAEPARQVPTREVPPVPERAGAVLSARSTQPSQASHVGTASKLSSSPGLTRPEPRAPIAPPPSRGFDAGPPSRPATPAPVAPTLEDDLSPAPFDDDGALHAGADDWPSEQLPPLREVEAPRRRWAGLLIALIVLLALGGGSYAAWLNRNELSTLVGMNLPAFLRMEPAPPPSPVAAETPIAAEETEGEDATPSPAPSPSETDAAGAEDDAGPQVAAVDPNDEADAPSEPAPAANPAVPPKFTQRLTSDGQEVDEGTGGANGSLGEGTSVAASTPPAPGAAPSTPGAPPASGADQPIVAAQTTPPPAAGQGETLAVGQRAIFYEERTSVAQGSAEAGSIVWSTVQESPGGDLPPEPAIRAEATIPGKDIQLRMTIRRNGDRTLPASHIVEMIFLTPDGFEGGGIENVLRVAMKGSEQETGSPLSGIPAKIADGYFLVALSDNAADRQANLNLLGSQSWIDVPIVYKSGRRALITLEKGLPGEKVFNDAIKAWGGTGG